MIEINEDAYITVITTYSHHFTVVNPSKRIIPLLYKLASRYTQFGMKYSPKTRRQVWGPVKTFAIYVSKGYEFRFHINQFQELLDSLHQNFIDPSTYSIRKEPEVLADKVDLVVRSSWKLREEQEEARRFITDDVSENHNSPLLMMGTGTGKTVTSLVATVDLGYRFAVVLLAQYVDKWISDIKQVMDIDESEIGVIQGSDSLIRSTYYPSSGMTIPKAFVISLSTMSRWYSIYEENRNSPLLEKYACLPGEFFQHLKIGTVLFDEVHQHPHAVFRLFCYTHTIKTIELSATLLAKDQSLQRVQHMMFPRNKRFDKITMKRYINCYSCAYQISEYHRSKIVTTEHGRNTYSQAAYEKALLRHKTIKSQYIEMLINMISEVYVKTYIEGDKLAVFVGTAKMANTLVEAIKKRWPEYDTRTYLEGDDYENVIKPDIRVTTVISGGTAVDIPNLRVCILTIAVDSPISNVQVLGRLRELKDRDVHFYYLYCTSIQKHMEYHERKVELFKMRVAKMNQMYIGTLKP